MTVLITVSSAIHEVYLFLSVEFQATGQQSAPLTIIVIPLLQECLSRAVGVGVVCEFYVRLTSVASSSPSWKRMRCTYGLLPCGMLPC
jgi:hypothetical protein